MKVITNRLVAQGKHFTSDKVETPIGWLKYASDIDEVLNSMVQQIYDEIGDSLLNINITPFVGLLEGRLFVPINYTIVYIYKVEENEEIKTKF